MTYTNSKASKRNNTESTRSSSIQTAIKEEDSIPNHITLSNRGVYYLKYIEIRN